VGTLALELSAPGIGNADVTRARIQLPEIPFTSAVAGAGPHVFDSRTSPSAVSPPV
jgi:hypothetical protein